MAIDLADKTGNGNTLTNVGASEVLGLMGTTTAVDLESGESDYLYAADSASLDLSGSFTLELVAKFESFPTSGGTNWLIVKGSDDSVSHFSYWFGVTDDGGGNMLLRLIVSSSGSYAVGNDKKVTWTAPSTGVEYRLSVSWDAVTGSTKFYVNGTQIGSTLITTATGSLYNSSENLAIGCERISTTPRNFTDGVLDDIRIWSVVRTQSEIDANKAVKLAGNETNLVAYWPFEELLTTVSDTLTLKYNIRQLASDTLTLIYNIKQLSSDTLTLKYNIRQLASDTLTLIYNIVNPLVSDVLALKYNIRQLASDTLTLKYSIRRLVSDTLTLIWDIVEYIEGLRQLPRFFAVPRNHPSIKKIHTMRPFITKVMKG